MKTPVQHLYVFFLALVVLGCPTSYAQQTWNGLAFGTTSAAVLDNPSLKDLHLEHVKEGLRSTQDWIFKEPDHPAMPFIAELRFGAGGLETVHLTLDLAAYSNNLNMANVQPDAKQPDKKVVLAFYFAVYYLGPTLLAKYGLPVDVSGECDQDVMEAMVHHVIKTCGKVWIYQSQKIEYTWVLPDKLCEVWYRKADNGL